MNEALFNLGFDEVGQTSSKKYAIKPRKKNKENKTNELNNRERKGNPKTYLRIKPKITSHIAIYNKKLNYYYLIEHRYYIELARTLADNVLRHLKISEILFQVIAVKYFTEFLP